MQGMVTETYLAFLGASPQLVVHPLTQFYGEWCWICTGEDAEARLLTPDLQHPSPLRGVREADLCSQEEMDFLLAKTTPASAGVVRCSAARQRGFYSVYFQVPKNTENFGPILDLCRFNRCVARKTFCMVTIKQLLKLLQPGNCFTTIDLKYTYFP